jgi:hypothetical protein
LLQYAPRDSLDDGHLAVSTGCDSDSDGDQNGPDDRRASLF